MTNQVNQPGKFDYEEAGLLFLTIIGGIWLLTNSLLLAVCVGIMIATIIASILWGSKLGVPWKALFSRFTQRREATPPLPTRSLYSFNLGQSTAVSRDVYQQLPHMGHVFVAGMTRYGKTVFLYGMIHDLISHHEPEELMIGFSDAKRVSFNIYSKLRHLFAPIAKDKESTEELLLLAKKEMYRRLKLFEDQGDKLCANVKDYYDLTGERLPWIVLIFDELADSIDPDSEAEKHLISVAKMGLATGIQLVLATQRPTKLGVSHEAQSQCATMFCTYMKAGTEYAIAKIPKEVWSQMKPKKGLFMVYTPEAAPVFLEQFPDLNGWGFIQAPYYEPEILEAKAKQRSDYDRQLTWASMMLPEWGGSADDKIEAIFALERHLDRRPSKAEIGQHFDITQKTAGTWYDRAYPEK